MQKIGWFHLRARSPSTFSSIASELDVPRERFSSIAIEPNLVRLGDGFKKYDSILPNNRDKIRTSDYITNIANTDVYNGSFISQTIRYWNVLPGSVISSAEDCVAKFTSLVRARDKFPNHVSW